MKKRIYYHDTDAGGVVYYGNYLKFLEEARTEYLENCGLSIVEMQKRNFHYAVRKCTINYKSPARYGDIIECDAKLKKITAAQLYFDQKIYNKKDGKLLLDSEVILVSLDNNFKPIQIPENIKSSLMNK